MVEKKPAGVKTGSRSRSSSPTRDGGTRQRGLGTRKREREEYLAQLAEEGGRGGLVAGRIRIGGEKGFVMCCHDLAI